MKENEFWSEDLPDTHLWLYNEVTFAFKFQAKRMEDIKEVEELVKAKKITPGTIYQSVPITPFSNFYSHYGIIIDVNEYGVEIFHLYKGIFIRQGQQIFIKFSTGNDDIFNFHRGVKFILDDPLNEHEIEAMRYRLKKICSKNHIPYGLKAKDTFNCENLVLHIKTGKKPLSSEVLNFENKFGKRGAVAVSCFDKVMFVTNKLGYIFFGE